MEFTLAASAREGLGSGQAYKIRQKGQVPAVLYGESKPAQHISIDAHDFGMIVFRGGVGKLIELKVDNATEHVLVKDLQRHPLKGNVIHVDFLRVAMDHEVNVKVPVHVTGEEKRAKDGAVLEVLVHELNVSCLPASIPDRINVDVTKLTLGNALHVKDLVLPNGIKVIDAPEEVLVVAAAPKAAEEATPAATEATGTEVVADKKEEA